MLSHPHFLWSDFFGARNAQKASLLSVLKENVLFASLNRRELLYLSKMVYDRVYQPGEIIFQQNDRSFGMYLIARGRVSIKTLGPDGETLVTTLGEGSFFGELSLVDPDTSRTATAVALENSILIGFFRPDLAEIMERKPEMAVKILYQLGVILGRRLIETTEKITLLSQARDFGQVHGDSI